MKVLCLLTCLLLGANAFAIKAPFQPWAEDLIDQDIMDLASGEIVVGSSVGKAANVALSGDATISNAGVLTIAAEAVDESMLADDAADGVNAARIARATYDVAVDGGAIGAYDLGVNLPANALITRSWFYTVTQFVDGGAGTVALSCEDANNIYSAADITGIAVGANTTGVQDDAIANFTGSIAATCAITATVAGAEQTAGKLIVFVEYVVVE